MVAAMKVAVVALLLTGAFFLLLGPVSALRRTKRRVPGTGDNNNSRAPSLSASLCGETRYDHSQGLPGPLVLRPVFPHANHHDGLGFRFFQSREGVPSDQFADFAQSHDEESRRKEKRAEKDSSPRSRGPIDMRTTRGGADPRRFFVANKGMGRTSASFYVETYSPRRRKVGSGRVVAVCECNGYTGNLDGMNVLQEYEGNKLSSELAYQCFHWMRQSLQLKSVSVYNAGRTAGAISYARGAVYAGFSFFKMKPEGEGASYRPAHPKALRHSTAFYIGKFVKINSAEGKIFPEEWKDVDLDMTFATRAGAIELTKL